MKSLLTFIDQFGAEEKLQIHPQKLVQRSIFGGIMTLILYGASFSYFLYEFIDWQMNNKLPKITSFQREIEESEIVEFPEKIFEIAQFPSEKNAIDPFDPQNIVLFPLVFKMEGNFNLNNVISSQFESVTLQNGYKRNQFYLEKIQIKGSPTRIGLSTEFIDYAVLLAVCNSTWLPKTFKCANTTTVAKFNKQLTYINLVFYTQQFDSKTQTLNYIPKSQKALLMQNSVSLYQINFQAQNLQVDEGILFQKMKQYKFAFDFSFACQQIDRQYVNQIYGIDNLLGIYMTINQIKSDVLIEYPKISEILADTGSIITWIMQISFIVYKYNQSICSENTIKEVIQIYFPDYQNLVIKKSMFGKVLKINKKDQDYEIDKIQQLLKQLYIIAEQKVNFINLQFEVSRLQLLVTDALGLNAIKNKMIKRQEMESLIKNCKIKLNNGSPIMKLQNSQHPQISSYDKNGDNYEGDMIQTTIGLLLQQNSKDPTSEYPNEYSLDSQIHPLEELKIEYISQINMIT